MSSTATVVTQQPAQQVLHRVSPAKQPTAVVVGAGLAGAVTASLLARRGFSVNVFERRTEYFKEGQLRGRSFALGLNARTAEVLKQAGLDVSTVGKRPSEAVALNGKMMPLPKGSDPERALYFVDRLYFGRELVQAAKAQEYPNGGAIQWHFGQALDDIDFDKKVATFTAWQPTQSASSSSSSSSMDGDGAAPTPRILAEYDLLVGADGANSAVRAKMAEHVPELTAETMLEMQATYKVFHGLEITPAIEKALPGISEQQPGDVAYFFRNLAPGHKGSISLRKQPDGTISGSMMGNTEWWDDATMEQQASIVFKNGMEEWLQEALDQMKEQRPSKLSRPIKVSQFHGPGCVLIGDSAHSVTPSLGQGCNAALESAAILAQTLDRVGLDAAPTAFTEARRKDAHALQQMDVNNVVASSSFPIVLGPEKKNVTPLHRFCAAVELLLPTLVLWPVLKKLWPRTFIEPTFTFHLAAYKTLPFGRMRDVLLLVGWSIALGVGAVLATLLKLAATKAAGLWAA